MRLVTKPYSSPDLRKFMDSLVMSNTMNFGSQVGNVPVKKTKAGRKTKYWSVTGRGSLRKRQPRGK